MSSVKVAVRLRPLNSREKDLNSRVVVEMADKSTCKKLVIFVE